MIGHEDKIRVEDRGYLTPCHIWTGRISEQGYGHVRDGKRVRNAHCVAWEKINGPIPAGLTLDHLCRVRACCNAGHVEPVTTAENLRRGVRTKLTLEQVAEIRAAAGITNVELASRYGVTAAWISRIRTGRNANRNGPIAAWAI